MAKFSLIFTIKKAQFIYITFNLKISGSNHASIKNKYVVLDSSFLFIGALLIVLFLFVVNI